MELQLHCERIADLANRGERRVLAELERVRDHPAARDWVVLHSVRIKPDRSPNGGEVDLVILIPGASTVVLLEIKGHESVEERDDRIFVRYQDGSRKDPLVQVDRARGDILSILSEARRKETVRTHVHVVTGVLLPFATLGKAGGVSWDRRQIVDEREMQEGIVEAIARVAGYATEGTVPQPLHPQAQAFVRDQFQPRFQPAHDPRSMIEAAEREALELTQQQSDVIDSIFDNDHIPHVVHGPAGSGKTVMAMDLLHRYLRENPGARVLYLCYNAFLSQKARHMADGLFEADTIHKFMSDIALHLCKPAERDAPDFLKNILPEKAALAADEEQITYDLVVVDEYPDIFEDPYLFFLDTIIEGGFAEGRWHFLGDVQQDIFKRDVGERFAAFEQNHGNGRALYRKVLRENLRNTRQIAELGRRIVKDDRIRALRADGAPVEIHGYSHLPEALEREVKRWLGAGYQPSEIVVISPEAASMDVTVGGHAIRVLSSVEESSPLGLTTARRFKGCETQVVILVDPQAISTEDEEQLRQLTYVAVTRAKHGLSVLYRTEDRAKFDALFGHRTS
jgi:Nuclease-related domain/UvrD-like helicase C-terminal domain/AAA domain